jgi:hypothetical protein
VESLDILSNQSVPLFNPRTQRWSEHFRWSASDAVILEPLTATGRATVALLELNSQQHLGIRRLLMARGLHPPA